MEVSSNKEDKVEMIKNYHCAPQEVNMTYNPTLLYIFLRELMIDLKLQGSNSQSFQILSR